MFNTRIVLNLEVIVISLLSYYLQCIRNNFLNWYHKRIRSGDYRPLFGKIFMQFSSPVYIILSTGLIDFINVKVVLETLFRQHSLLT